jgi:hypothetical protein
LILKPSYLKGILASNSGTSSVGRASGCQSEGRRFEPGVPHHLFYISIFFKYKVKLFS